ncbi:DUF805 domain-containing protein [Sphingomonas oligophenolica]|uniref:DUF805 domain-containing protein n=2 Tax=Sphingomonas oligophenolica TaxID=301154 RepID=A0A502CJ77_9SPHN|nr:DUF805 domain-containing protein [Sphingomonas oligophenolica]TPG13247.1 DUF805 domain-containing protein [Sphingomonas oligophenolica]
MDDYLGWLTLPLKRYADFQGRSTRREFWMFHLLPVAIVILAIMLQGASMVLAAIALLAMAVPLLAVQIRRFHDQDRSGWFVAINLIPYLGSLIVLVMLALPGTAGENRFGPDPKAG